MPAPRLRSCAIALVAGAALALSGCVASGEPLDDVATGDWVLATASQDGGELNLADSRVTLTADAESFSGSGPCNAYGAAIAGSTANLEILSFRQTEAGCDEAIMALETAYFGLLQSASTVALEDGQLVLTGDAGELRFDPAAEDTAADALVGTTWTLQSVTAQGAEVPISPDAQGAMPSLTLDEGGRTSGSTGCRDIALDYAVAEDVVSFDGFPAESPACSAETAGQDDVLFTLLGFGFAAEIAEGVLTAQNTEFGLVATFTAG